jgi:ParB family chromosome partitioning protein
MRIKRRYPTQAGATAPARRYPAARRNSTRYGAEEIAARFGVTPRIVRQRLRLVAVSPKLMQVYRDGGLTLDQLSAFAVNFAS